MPDQRANPQGSELPLNQIRKKTAEPCVADTVMPSAQSSLGLPNEGRDRVAILSSTRRAEEARQPWKRGRPTGKSMNGRVETSEAMGNCKQGGIPKRDRASTRGTFPSKDSTETIPLPLNA